MGEAGLEASVLDAGALVAFERGDRRVRALIASTEGRLIVPAPVLAQVWRNGARQAALAALIKEERVIVEVLDTTLAKAAGVLCGRSGTSDIVDASVVIAARLHRALVVTSDPDDLRRIDPSIHLETL
jgi:hypothetical protein